MKYLARGLLFVVAAMMPVYLWLDHGRLLPASVRDRPWPFAVAAVLLAGAAALLHRRARIAAPIVAGLTTALLFSTAHARYRLPPSSSAGVGKPLANVPLTDSDGKPFAVTELTGQPTLLLWFRGSWCPYCRKQIVDLVAELGPYARAGQLPFRVVGIAPDPPEPLGKMRRDAQIPFVLLSDPDRHLFSACELAHCVAVVDSQGIVRWSVVSGNWEKDLPARALLQAVYRAR